MKSDVIIVGAGPAGSTCATELAENGFHVILIEKSRIGRYKPCAGGLLGDNEKEFGKLPNYIRQQSINQIVIGNRDSIGKLFPVLEGDTYGTLVYRTEYDRYLAETAQSAGVEIYFETEAISATRHSDRIEVEAYFHKEKKSTTFKADTLIIASGLSSSKLQRSLGIEYPKEVVNCIQAEFQISEELLDERFEGGDIEIYWDTQRIGNHGYAWIFTKPGGLSVGILDYMVKIDNLKQIISSHPLIAPRLEGAKPLYIENKHFWAAPIPDRIIEYTYYPRILIIGDAAGFVDRMNYEGIFYARKSGRIAAEVVSKAISRKNFTAAFLEHYEKKWYQEIYLPYLMASRLAHHFYYHSSYLDEFAKAVVEVLNDEIVMNNLYQAAREKKIKYLFNSEIFQLEIVKKLQKVNDQNTFNDMYKHFLHKNPV